MNTAFDTHKQIPMSLNFPIPTEAFRKRLKSFILIRVPNESDAEDVLQNVFVKMYSRLSTLRNEGKIVAWVYQIVRNEIAEYHRYHAKEARNLVINEDEDLLSLLPSSDSLDTNEAHSTIASCLTAMLECLPEQSRQAILMTEYNNQTQKEMADQLGISLSGAKSRVQRARSKLKEILLSCCNLEFDRVGNIIDYAPRNSDCASCIC